MQSIDPKLYYVEDLFSTEVTKVFGPRLFVGTTADFPEVDSYKSLLIGGEPVTIRRAQQGLRAFSNVCLHRNNLIDPIGTGCKPFRCAYHAWQYDSNGHVSRVPRVAISSLSRGALPEFGIQVEDGLVFLALGDRTPDTAKVLPTLKRLGIRYTAPYYRASLDHECNWKLLVENVLEGYHISSVHSNSFVPTGITSNADYEWASDEYSCWNIVTPKILDRRSARLLSIIPGTKPQYAHGYIFPNLFFSNGNNHIGYIGYFIPTSAGHTRLEWSLFELPLLLKQNPVIRESIRQSAIDFTHTVLLEDKAIVEMCQLGLRSPFAGYQLQELEPRVINFHATYQRAMGDV